MNGGHGRYQGLMCWLRRGFQRWGKGRSGPDEALVWPPPAEGEACPGQQEQLNKGCGQAASSSSSSLVFPIPAILQPCQGVASLRTVPNQVA